MLLPWKAEKLVSENLARKLILDQFPALWVDEIQLFGEGWDNTAYLVNNRYVFRFPRREVAAPLIQTECDVLPIVALNLSLPIPNPVFVGKASEDYSWPFSGYELLPGKTACKASLSLEQRIEAAKPLATFLKALHEFPLEKFKHVSLSPDRFRKLDVPFKLPKLRETLSELSQKSLIDNAEFYEKMAVENGIQRRQPKNCLVHGDLYVRHLLVNESGKLNGVLDWGDVHLGDPAVDITIMLTFLPPAGRRIFQDNYGKIDEETLKLAIFRAIFHTANVLRFAADINDDDLLREAKLAFQFIASALNTKSLRSFFRSNG